MLWLYLLQHKGQTKNMGKKAKDMTGEVYGKLTVISRAGSSNVGRVATWNCQCECGNLCVVRGTCLRSGHTKSCGCLQKEIATKTHMKDLTEQRFGRLLVVGLSGKDGKNGSLYWKCACDCGNIVIVRSDALISGRCESCGCLNRECASERMSHQSGADNHMYGRTGSKHPNWQGGITPEHSIIRNSFAMKSWRKAVFERDSFTCQLCGDDNGGNLNAHHIKPFALYPELRFDVDNGLTLCESCHIDIHRNGRCKNEFTSSTVAREAGRFVCFAP